MGDGGGTLQTPVGARPTSGGSQIVITSENNVGTNKGALRKQGLGFGHCRTVPEEPKQITHAALLGNHSFDSAVRCSHSGEILKCGRANEP